MRNTNKKGFTIIELVVVVAVIAILAAVLIPTFSGIIEKAKLSADQQAITNMNRIVAEEKSLESFDYASDAVNALYKNGFNVGKLTPYSKGHHYAYDFEDNKFYLLDAEGNITFPANAKEGTKANLWGFFNNGKADADKIDGITKYIALSSIVDENLFNKGDCVFFNGEYTIDLNNKAIYVADGTKDRITLLNGTIADGVKGNYKVGDGAVAKTIYTVDETNPLKFNGTVENNVLLIENMLFNAANNGNFLHFNDFGGATEVIFKNCTFDFTEATVAVTIGDKMSTSVTSYTLENCDFNMQAQNVNINGHAGETAPDVTVKNCYFSSGRGLNIGASQGYYPSIFDDITIEKNVFVDNGSSNKARPSIQFAAEDSAASATQYGKFTAKSITIKDNTFCINDIAVRIHDSIAEMTNKTMVVTISGNTIPAGAIIIDGDGAVKAGAIADVWAPKFN